MPKTNARGYDYKVTFFAPHLTKLRNPKRPKFETKEVVERYADAEVPLRRDVEVGAAEVTQYLYRQPDVDGALAALIEKLPEIRKVAGVQISKADVLRAHETGSIKFERIGH